MLLDPFAGSRRLDNGALFYEAQDADFAESLGNEEQLRAEYAKLRDLNDTSIEVDESNLEELRIAVLQELERSAPKTLDEFNEIMDKEFSIFKEGEKYDFVKDLKNAYEDGLAETQASKILDTIPAHAFWDIKTPLNKPVQKYVNPYNPFRGIPFGSFFEFR